MLASICTKPWWLCIWQGNYKNTGGNISWWADVHNILKPQDLTNCETGNPITETPEGYVVILALPWQRISSQITLICSLSCISHLLTFLSWSHLEDILYSSHLEDILYSNRTFCSGMLLHHGQLLLLLQSMYSSLKGFPGVSCYPHINDTKSISTLFRMMQNTTIY